MLVARTHRSRQAFHSPKDHRADYRKVELQSEWAMEMLASVTAVPESAWLSGEQWLASLWEVHGSALLLPRVSMWRRAEP